MSKRRSLEIMLLSPLKAEWSVDMMRTAGFSASRYVLALPEFLWLDSR